MSTRTYIDLEHYLVLLEHQHPLSVFLAYVEMYMKIVLNNSGKFLSYHFILIHCINSPAVRLKMLFSIWDFTFCHRVDSLQNQIYRKVVFIILSIEWESHIREWRYKSVTLKAFGAKVCFSKNKKWCFWKTIYFRRNYSF